MWGWRAILPSPPSRPRTCWYGFEKIRRGCGSSSCGWSAPSRQPESVRAPRRSRMPEWGKGNAAARLEMSAHRRGGPGVPMADVIDLRSDTVTQPTDEMREAMARAVVGDDVFGEDPTVRDLEALAASMLGKEAGLFVPSGTMANLVAVLTHTQKGDEIFVEADAHIYCNEAGSMSAVAGAMPHPIAGRSGYIAPEQLREAIRPSNVHYPVPRLVCIENTHNRAGGIPFTPQEMDAICVTAHELGLAVHVDGARLFNAAVALGVPASTLVRHADSAMFCVSKGLSAPVGSVVVGSRAFIDRARRFRKMVGGGMRQAGVIAVAGVH